MVEGRRVEGRKGGAGDLFRRCSQARLASLESVGIDWERKPPGCAWCFRTGIRLTRGYCVSSLRDFSNFRLEIGDLLNG